MNTASTLPAGLEHVRTTQTFTAASTPPGLRREHHLAAGIWGRLVVESGSLTIVFDDEPAATCDVQTGASVIIPPQRPHHVELGPDATFAIEMHRERPPQRVVSTDPELDRIARSVVAAGHAPGVAIVVVTPDGRLVGGAAGDAILGERPMTIHSACNWFSITKIAIATTAMRLAERGVVDLDKPVANELGDTWPKAFAQVTLRHLLAHTAGLRNPLPIRWVHRAGNPPRDQRTFLAEQMRRQQRPRHTPGTRVSYSNVGYLAAGVLIAQATGRPLDAVVEDELLRPLGMTHTAFAWQRLTNTAPAVGYHRAPAMMGPLLRRIVPDNIVTDRHGHHFALAPFEVDGPAYGGLIGSTSDAAPLVALHAGHGRVDGRQLIGEASLAAMRDGIGWIEHDGLMPIQQLGGGMGYFNVMRLNPAVQSGAVIFSNTSRRWNISHAADAAIAATL